MERTRFVFWLLAIGFVYILGWFIPIMDVDAAQYASMGRELLQDHDNWLQFFNRNEAYLDKPPLLFWLTATSFKLFGVHDWAYRLPQFLAAGLCGYATYQWAKRLYGPDVARVATLILLSTQAFFLMSHDCRTDLLLTTGVAVALWQGTLFLDKPNAPLALGFAFGLCVGLLAKGPIALIATGAGLLPKLWQERRWTMLLSPWWLLVALVVAIGLAPMTWGLYQQYGIKGVRFFYWTQSFGRITGESEWNNDVPWFFLSENLLWAFLPWVGLFIHGFILRLVQRKGTEWQSLWGFLLPFVALSASAYQLPHYMNVTFPAAAVLTSAWLYQGLPIKIHTIALRVLFPIIAIVGIALQLWAFPKANYIGLAALVLGIVSFQWVKSKAQPMEQLLTVGLTLAISVNAFLHLGLYPILLEYQSTTTLAKKLPLLGVKPSEVVTYKFNAQSLDYYLGRIVPEAKDELALKAYADGQHAIWLKEEDSMPLMNAGFEVVPIIKLPDYPVAKLSIPFVNPVSRPQTLQYFLLARVYYRGPMTMPVAYIYQP